MFLNIFNNLTTTTLIMIETKVTLDFINEVAKKVCEKYEIKSEQIAQITIYSDHIIFHTKDNGIGTLKIML